MDMTLENSVGEASPAPAPTDAVPALLKNVLVPRSDLPGKYDRSDVLIAQGVLLKIAAAGTVVLADCPAGTVEEDCTERMLMPGFVNGHTHSVEHWARGLIKPLPLELWVLQLIRHEPRGVEGWAGSDSWTKTPAAAIAVSAMHCGVEALLTGATAIMDHLLVRNMDDLAAAVAAYKALGIRAYIAPMLGDDMQPCVNCESPVSNASPRRAPFYPYRHLTSPPFSRYRVRLQTSPSRATARGAMPLPSPKPPPPAAHATAAPSDREASSAPRRASGTPTSRRQAFIPNS
jgi:hypothetical protein